MFLAEWLYILIPVFLILISLLIVRYSEDSSSSRAKRFFHALRHPVALKSMSDEVVGQLPEEERDGYLKGQLVARLVVVYLVLMVFLLGNIIATFNYVMADVIFPINQGSTGDLRIWSAVVLNNPFSGGWLGTFPWYGGGTLPPLNVDTYHEPWDWVYWLAPITDNPEFVSNIFPVFLITPVLMGLVYLIPLARRSIRESYLPSLLLFNSGMLSMMYGIFNCFAVTQYLLDPSSTITYGLVTVTAASMHGLPLSMMQLLVPALIGFFLVFMVLGKKLGGIHYPENQKAQRFFLMFVALTYWISLYFVILV